MDQAASLDHVVVNALFETDAAAACFAALGFALTPRGHHSLGSLNHLMMFDDHYLELVGLPLGTDTLRREILDSPLGIDGLVFKTDDADATFARLTQGGIGAEAPRAFSRPVAIDGAEQLARFRTTRLAAGQLAAGRVYFCEHLTPEWVFRPEWTVHPNGACGLAELLVVAADPGAEAARYAAVAGVADTQAGHVMSAALAGASLPGFQLAGFQLAFADPAAYRARYGALLDQADAAQRPSQFGALVVRVADPGALRRRLEALAANDPDHSYHIRHAADGRASTVALRAFNTMIEFIGACEP
jgi:hypothetical protein